MDFQVLASLPNILQAWKTYAKGKMKKEEIVRYWRNMEDHLFLLHEELVGKTYMHGAYDCFMVHDTKERLIHKAHVRD